MCLNKSSNHPASPPSSLSKRNIRFGASARVGLIDANLEASFEGISVYGSPPGGGSIRRSLSHSKVGTEGEVLEMLTAGQLINALSELGQMSNRLTHKQLLEFFTYEASESTSRFNVCTGDGGTSDVDLLTSSATAVGEGEDWKTRLARRHDFESIIYRLARFRYSEKNYEPTQAMKMYCDSFLYPSGTYY